MGDARAVNLRWKLADASEGQGLLFADDELVERHVGTGEYRGMEFLHVNARRVAELCAGEWGLWRTTSMNLEKVRDYLPHFDLTDEDRSIVAQRVEELLKAMNDRPKGTKWRLRARVGDKVKWYNVID